MFCEILNTRQIGGEPKRRWFVDEDLELITWFGEDEGLSGFNFVM